MALRRGFKTEAMSVGRDIRAELHISAAAPFDPRVLAECLAIPIVPLSHLAKQIPAAVRYFRGRGEGEFSAATIFAGTERLIVHNDIHALCRQANDLAHELSHALLFHEPKPALDVLGCRDWDADCEDEANYLAGVLLVPEEVTIAVVRRGLSLDTAADAFGVSVPLMRWRINATGARVRVARARKVWAGK